jgi:hypothetical protein
VAVQIFNDCSALIYDQKGNKLASVKILEHYKDDNSIDVPDLPELVIGSVCEVLVLTAPTPVVYKGRIHKLAECKNIKLFKGVSSCKRRETRYLTDLPAQIEGLFYDGKLYPLHSALEARVINISKSGVRLLAKFNALNIGCRFSMRVKIGNDTKLLTADVVFRRDTPPESTVFGCHLAAQGGS